MDLSVKSITTADQDELMREVHENEQRIAAIKQLVAEEYDNLSNPVPYISQLSS